MDADVPPPSSLSAALRDHMHEKIEQGHRVLFISGSQGIGKSTSLAYVASQIPNAVVLSIDDFYLTKSARSELASAIHPLLQTRGAPGTHAVSELIDTIQFLRAAEQDSEILVPVFDKPSDDRKPKEHWRKLKGEPSVIILEGWLLGVLPDISSMTSPPINKVEQSDKNGAWRNYQEAQLSGPYAELWDLADSFIHLEAPNFETVQKWRIQQEETNLGIPRGALPQKRREWVMSFILYYERLTRRMLEGHKRSGTRIIVDEFREPINLD